MDIAKAQAQLLKGRDMEEILGGIGWKEFEEFCAAVLEEHGWKPRRNFRFKTGRRYEIDIVAGKCNSVLAIDCKHWGIRPGKACQLSQAAAMQTERAAELSKVKTLEWLNKEMEFHPVIVTLMQEDVTQENGVWVVPAFKLNNFLLEMDSL